MTAGPGLKTLDQWIEELERALKRDDHADEERTKMRETFERALETADDDQRDQQQ